MLIATGPQKAIKLAERALVNDPLDAAIVGLLGRIHLTAGNEPEAVAAFTVSGQLGWHDTLTQIYWMEQAIRVQDMKVAAARLDALLRQAPIFENRDQLINVLLQNPQGKMELAQRLKLVPSWTQTFANLSNEATAAQIGDRAEVLQMAGRGVLGCNSTGRLVNRLISVNLLQPAVALWRSNCMETAALIYDGGFDKLDTTQFATGFDWELADNGDLDAKVPETPTGNRLLTLTVSGVNTKQVIRQMLALMPGRYRLNWRMPGTSAASARALSVTLACNPNLADAVVGHGAGPNDTYFIDFVVDDTCPSRRLTFWLAPRNTITLDDVVLRKHS